MTISKKDESVKIEVLLGVKRNLRLNLRFGYHKNDKSGVSDGFYFVASVFNTTKDDIEVSTPITTEKGLYRLIQEFDGFTLVNDYRSIVSTLTPYFSLHLHKLNGLPMHCVENSLYTAYYKGDVEETFKYLSIKDLNQVDKAKLITAIEEYCAMRKRVDNGDLREIRFTAEVNRYLDPIRGKFKRSLEETGYFTDRQEKADLLIEIINRYKNHERD